MLLIMSVFLLRYRGIPSGSHQGYLLSILFCFMQYNQSILKFQTNFNQFENLWNSRDYDNPSCLLLDDTNPLPVYFVQQIQIGWSSSWLRIPLHRLVFAKTAAPSLLYCTMKSSNLGIARKLKVN